MVVFVNPKQALFCNQSETEYELQSYRTAGCSQKQRGHLRPSYQASMIYYLLLSFIKFQTKCRHSLHELTRIVGELFLDNIYLIETLTITFDKYKLVKRKQVQLSLF